MATIAKTNIRMWLLSGVVSLGLSALPLLSHAQTIQTNRVQENILLVEVCSGSNNGKIQAILNDAFTTNAVRLCDGRASQNDDICALLPYVVDKPYVNPTNKKYIEHCSSSQGITAENLESGNAVSTGTSSGGSNAFSGSGRSGIRGGSVGGGNGDGASSDGISGADSASASGITTGDTGNSGNIFDDNSGPSFSVVDGTSPNSGRSSPGNSGSANNNSSSSPFSGTTTSSTSGFGSSRDFGLTNQPSNSTTSSSSGGFNSTTNFFNSNNSSSGGGTSTSSTSSGGINIPFNITNDDAKNVTDGKCTGFDMSLGYNFGGVTDCTKTGSSASDGTLIDANLGLTTDGFDATEILGCDGLDVGALVGKGLGIGGGVDVGNLTQEFGNYLKSTLAQEALTMIYSDPAIAGIQDNLKAVGNMRAQLLQARCNATEIRSKAAKNKRLHSEAQEKCLKEKKGTGSTECSDPEILTPYIQEVEESPRWKEDFSKRICDKEGSDAGCSWTTLLPNYRTKIDEEKKTVLGPDGEPVSTSQEPITPPAMTNDDVHSVAEQAAMDIMDEKLQRADAYVHEFGYTQALRQALNRSSEAMPISRTSSDGAPVQGHDYIYDLSEAILGAQSCRGSVIESFNFNKPIFSSTQALIDSSGGVAPAAPSGGAPATSSSSGGGTPSTPAAPTDGGSDTSTGDTDTSSAQVTRPVSGPITSPYGQRAIKVYGGRRKMHNGIDLRAGVGTPVQAANGGRVINVNASNCNGLKLVTVTSLDGHLASRYLHVSSFQKPNGSVVQQGEVVALSGNTGAPQCSGGPHLHFELKVDGQRVDPAPYLGENPPALPDDFKVDGHGDQPAALAIAGTMSGQENLDREFVEKLQEDLNNIGTHILQATECLTYRHIHPHVYIKLSSLPEGQAQGFIKGMSDIIADEATLAVMNALIFELSYAIARKGVEGENGLNPDMKAFANMQLRLLKDMRDAALSMKKIHGDIADRISNMNKIIEDSASANAPR